MSRLPTETGTASAFDAEAFVLFVKANVNNDKLDASDFRQLVRNCLKSQPPSLKPYKGETLTKCRHCGTALTLENGQWVRGTDGVLRQYCWIDQEKGSVLHEPTEVSRSL